MKKALLILAACFIVAGFASAVAAADVKMVLATGGTAGTYYPFGGAMAKIWNSKIPGMNVTAQATGASVENVRLVNRGEAELAIVQSDTIDFAFNAKEAFKEKLTKMAVLAVLYPEVIQVVVRGDSKIDSFDDLKGMKIGVGAPGQRHRGQFPPALRRLRPQEGGHKGPVPLLLRERGTVQGQAHRRLHRHGGYPQRGDHGYRLPAQHPDHQHRRQQGRPHRQEIPLPEPLYDPGQHL